MNLFCHGIYFGGLIRCPGPVFYSLHPLFGYAHTWLMGCPNPCKLQKNWECTFVKVFTHTKTKWASKKHFIIGLQNYQLECLANPAMMGRIGPCKLAISFEFFFHSNFVFICVKIFKKIHFQLCSILLRLGQPNSHMCSEKKSQKVRRKKILEWFPGNPAWEVWWTIYCKLI